MSLIDNRAFSFYAYVKVIDPRHIEDAYHQYPDDYSRQKYYKRTHKDLLKKK